MKKISFVILVLLCISMLTSCAIFPSQRLDFMLNKDGQSYSVIGIGSFKGNYVVIPAKYKGLPVTSIHGYAFMECDSIRFVSIPNSVTEIGKYAFKDCKSLLSVKIPNSVVSIGESAFYNCSLLIRVKMSDSVTSIGNYAFSGCSLLKKIKLPSSLTYIGERAFKDCYRLERIVISESVTHIGVDAFKYCENITIYCEAESQPDGWNSSWNYSNRPVVWGYEGE